MEPLPLFPWRKAKQPWYLEGRLGLTHIEGNIDNWKLLKRMEIKDREKGEPVGSRTKAKTKRVTGTSAGTGSAGSALEQGRR